MPLQWIACSVVGRSAEREPLGPSRPPALRGKTSGWISRSQRGARQASARPGWRRRAGARGRWLMPTGSRWQVTGGVPGWQPARCGTLGGLRSWASLGESVGVSNLCPATKLRDAFRAPSITAAKPLLPLGSSFAAPRMLPPHGGCTDGAGARSPSAWVNLCCEMPRGHTQGCHSDFPNRFSS